MSKYGFKEITVANLTEPDFGPCFPHFTADNWMEANLKPALNPSVPKDVAALAEVGRGCMIYGWFYYPLLTVATEHCHRVLETGAKVRCQQLGIPITRPTKKGKPVATTFAENIAALLKQGAISTSDELRWNLTRKLRNRASHPDFQTILTPAMNLRNLRTTIELLNKLFP